MFSIAGKLQKKYIGTQDSNKSPRVLLLNLAKYCPGRITLSIALGFASAVFSGVNTALLFPLFLQLLGQEAQLSSLPRLLQYIVEPFERLPEQFRLPAMLVAILGTIMLKAFVGYLNTLVNVSLRRKLMNHIRETGFRLIMDVDIEYFDRMQIGDIIRRINGESDRSTRAILTYVKTANVAITILVYLCILISISWTLTISSSLVLLTTLIPSRFYNERAKEFGRQLTERTHAYSVNLIEILSGMRLIRTVATEDAEYQKLLGLIHAHEKAEFKTQMNSAAIGPINEITSVLALIGIILIGRLFFADNLEAFSAILLIYLIILFRLMPYVGQLNSIRNSLANTTASVEVLYDFLRSDNKPFMQQGTRIFQGLNEGISFDKISFTYPRTSKQVLKNVSLHIPKGETLALVGSSGSGKSTLADLLARFYDPTDGQIQLDGVDLKDFNLASFRREIGVVSQETFLFNNTVRNNIRYARPDATDEEIIEASKRANAYEFITQLPLGWDTLIGDRGVMLSGGQRQRLAIARAILQDPQILILDEATSALDTVSERLVQEAVNELSVDRTTLVIAHRLSTIRNANQIAVMSHGEVVERGSHKQLLMLNGEYRKLYDMQFGDNDSDKKEKYLAQASYKARTELNSVLGSLSLISEDLIETEEEKELVKTDIQRSTKNVLRILEDIEKLVKT